MSRAQVRAPLVAGTVAVVSLVASLGAAGGAPVEEPGVVGAVALGGVVGALALLIATVVRRADR